MTTIQAVEVSGEFRIDSRVMATRLGNTHKSLMALVSDYDSEFQTLGILPFQTEVIAKRGQPAKYLLLNEDQCYFLLTLVRNSLAVVALKLELVQLFKVTRDQAMKALLPSQDYTELNRLAGLTAQAITHQVQQAKIELRQEVSDDMDAKIGSLQASSEQQHDVKRLVKLVVGGRQRLSLANAIFASVYRECWDACRIGNLPSMTRVQYPQAVAFLRAELARLAELGDSGLFPEDGKNGSQVSA